MSGSAWQMMAIAIVLSQISACTLCRNEISEEIPSPDGGFKAVVFQRDCGAATGFSTHISILTATDSPGNGSGNVFVADDNHGAVRAGPHGLLEVSVRWISSNRVIVEYPKGSRVFKHEARWKNIEIHYSDTAMPGKRSSLKSADCPSGADRDYTSRKLISIVARTITGFPAFRAGSKRQVLTASMAF